MSRAAIGAAGVLLIAVGVVGGMSAAAETEVDRNAQASRMVGVDVGSWSAAVLSGLVILAGALFAVAVARRRSVPSGQRV